MTNRKVLVVEDNTVEQRVLTILLERYGYTPVIARNGKHALELIAESDFAVVLMDWEMPDMNGLQCTAAIRKMEEVSGKYLPVIAVTARALLGDRQRCLDAGMDDYLSKPFTPKQFEQMLGYWSAREAARFIG